MQEKSHFSQIFKAWGWKHRREIEVNRHMNVHTHTQTQKHSPPFFAILLYIETIFQKLVSLFARLHCHTPWAQRLKYRVFLNLFCVSFLPWAHTRFTYNFSFLDSPDNCTFWRFLTDLYCVCFVSPRTAILDLAIVSYSFTLLCLRETPAALLLEVDSGLGKVKVSIL